MKAFLAFLLYLPLLVAAYPPLFGDPPSESIYPIANNISEFKEDCRDRYVKAANNLTRALTRVLDNPFDSDAYGVRVLLYENGATGDNSGRISS